MRIGILGSGLMGGKLGLLFARAGHEVRFSYSRSQKKLERLAQQAGRKASAASLEEAARHSDVLVLSIHWSRLTDVLKQTGRLAGKIVLTTTLPMNKQNTELILGRTTSAAEQLAKKIPKAHVVAAFNTIPSEVLFDVFKNKKKSGRPGLVYCGDHAKSKTVVQSLIRSLGFDPVDLGPLRMARTTEPFALMIGQLSYEMSSNPRLAYFFRRYGKN